MVWPMSWDDALIGRNVRSDSREGQWRCVAQCSTGAAIAASRTRSQGRTVPGERGQILALVIGNPVFPTTKYYANPFESQRSHRRMVVLALAALLLVVASPSTRWNDPPIRENFAAETWDRTSGNGPTSFSRSSPSPAQSHCTIALPRHCHNALAASQTPPTSAALSPHPLPEETQR